LRGGRTGIVVFAIGAFAMKLGLSASNRQASGFGVVPRGAIDASQQIEARKGRPPRLVGYVPGQRLLEVLQPNDDVVEVVDWYPPASVPEPEAGRSRLEELVKEAPFAYIVSAESVSGRVSTTGDWIFATIAGRVAQVLKKSDTAVKVGETVTFDTPGGEVRIGGQTIRAMKKGTLPFEVGRSYLIFLRFRDGQLFAYPDEVAVLDDTKVGALSVAGQDTFKALELGTVLDRISSFLSIKR